MAAVTTTVPTRDLAISEVADRTGVSIDALRYYERIGLLHIGRDPGGRRRYTERDLGRVVFITRLRAAGLPISDLQRYFALVDAGPHTEPERAAVLEQHRDALVDRIAQLQTALAMVERKIELYGGSLTTCTPQNGDDR